MAHFHIQPDSEGRPERDPLGASEAQMREARSSVAADESFEARTQKISQACQKHFSESGPDYPGGSAYAYIEKTYDDVVIFKKGDKTFSVGYDMEGDEVVFDEPKEVRLTYTPVKVREANSRSSNPTTMALVNERKRKKKGKIDKGYTGSIGPEVRRTTGPY